MLKTFTTKLLFLAALVPGFAQETDLQKVLKGKEPLTLRWIRAKTTSWSPLAENQIIAQPTIKPIVAHAGYEPDVQKTAVIWTNGEKFSGTFEIIDMRKNAQPPAEPIVYTGSLKEWGNHIWGGNNLIADFSDFRTPGFYKIRVKLNETKETTDSWPFEIREDIYFDLAKKAVNWFQYQRCGVAVPGWYNACHLDDAKIDGKTVNVTGGWHDAGDYNKWPTYTPPPLYAIAMFHDANFNRLTDSEKNKVKEELAWELSFLCKDQKEDGTFYSIISSYEKPWIFAGIPEAEGQRVGVNYNVGNGDPASTSNCIKIAAAVLNAATIIRDKYPSLADSCLNLAEKPYQRALKVNYKDKKAETERKEYLAIQTGLLGADIAFYKWYKLDKYKKDAEQRVKNILAAQSKEGTFFRDFDKTEGFTYPDLFLVTLYEYYKTFKDDPLNKEIEAAFKKYSDFYKPYCTRSPFGHTGTFDPNGDYSQITENKSAGLNAWAFAFTYTFTQNAEYRNMAISNLNWILGFNPADVSMMAGVGVGPGAYHHRYTAIAGHEDGVVPGGVLNGIKAGDGGILFLGDEGAENFVLGHYLPKDYPVIDTDVKGWTYAWWPNEYHIPNNAYFIMAAYMISNK